MKAQTIRDSLEMKLQQVTIPGGTLVNVIELLPQAQVCVVDYMGQHGLFKLQDFVQAPSEVSESNQTTTVVGG